MNNNTNNNEGSTMNTDTNTPTELSNEPECGHKQFASIERGTYNPNLFCIFLKDYHSERYYYKSYSDFETAHAKATWRISFCLKCRHTWNAHRAVNN